MGEQVTSLTLFAFRCQGWWPPLCCNKGVLKDVFQDLRRFTLAPFLRLQAKALVIEANRDFRAPARVARFFCLKIREVDAKVRVRQ